MSSNEKKDVEMTDVSNRDTTVEKSKSAAEEALLKQISSAIESTQKRIDAQSDQKTLDSVLDELLTLEKKARVAADGDNTTRIVVHIVDLCVQCGAWQKLFELLHVLSRKRNQIRQAITRMVQQAMDVGIERSPDKQTRLTLINELRKITEGKVCL